ncbi:unnamed protein product [Brachionus calyciflorus]|uniref:FLYWCH-type domain-containing protein n=1 Tax=Brachionus calyciflorus TaxID=104777 RepID=A0A814M9L4_9BILA|nr:unnamed protein product [Brachionus calyciflorus]
MRTLEISEDKLADLNQLGGRILIDELNYEYRVDYESKTSNKITWRCLVVGCPPRCCINGYVNKPIKFKNSNHSHPADVNTIKKSLIVNDLKKEAQLYEDKPTRKIITEKQLNVSIETAISLPSYDALRQTVLNYQMSSK